MFNLFSGQGLGIAGTQNIAFGFGATYVTEIEVPARNVNFVDSGSRRPIKVSVFDNPYSRHPSDDDEIALIMAHIISVIV